MTNAKDGKKDARIQKRDEATGNGNFINLEAHAKGISLLLTSGLTMYLAWRNQYLDALCGACLALAAATSDRLKKIKIGRQGLESEWQTARQSRPPGH
jgi:putative component of toxin-antitoxin plasmid stabilization module